MGQQEVMDLLDKSKRHWFTSDEIAELICVSKGSVGRCLKILRIQGVVKYDQEHPAKYKFKG